MRGQYKNPYYSVQYKLSLAQREQRAYLFKETLSLIALLYGHTIDAGYKQVEDYGGMTGQSFNRELLFRKLVLDGRIRARQDIKVTEQKARENALLEQLKKSQQ